MKSSMLMLGAFIVFTLGVYAQSNERLTGPKAKNLKVWQHEFSRRSAVVFVPFNKKKLTGPAVKNRKAWQRDQVAGTKVAIVFRRRPTVTGAKAKHYWAKRNRATYLTALPTQRLSGRSRAGK